MGGATDRRRRRAGCGRRAGPRFARAKPPAPLEDGHPLRTSIDELGSATSAPEQLVANVRRYLHVVDIVLGGIASIALVIASLGIANALLAAVRGRRRGMGG